MMYFLTLFFCSSALRFNEVGPGSISTIEEQKLIAGGRRRRRKGNGNYYDSPNVEYLIRYPGTRVTDAVKVAAYKDKLAADIAIICLSHLVLTAGVSEAKATVDKQIKDNLKITAWAISDAGTFTDLVTWPENPGWKTITPVTPSVFDSLFKTTTFSTALQVEIVKGEVLPAYVGYGVTGAASVTERTVSTSTLTGTLRMEFAVSNPAGGPAGASPRSSFGSAYTPADAEFQGNSQVFMYEAKEALAAAFGVNKDYVTIERSDHLPEMCSTQIMFNFPTTQVAENDQASADLVTAAAIKDRNLHAVFATAAATILNVDADKIQVMTFVQKSKDATQGTGDNDRVFDIQLQYETACTGVDKADGATSWKVFWYDEEATRVRTQIGLTAADHILISNKIWTEAKKSSPFEVTFSGQALTDFDAIIAAGGKTGVNPKQIVLKEMTLTTANKNHLCGTGGTGNDGATPPKGGEGELCVYKYGGDKPLGTGASTAKDTNIMNKNWNERKNAVGKTQAEQDVNAQYRIKYAIAIKNAVDHNAATLIKSYVAMADGSAEQNDAFSVKVKESMAGATNLLGLGCTVTKVWMKSEATTTLY